MKLTKKALTGAALTGAAVSLGSGVAGLIIAKKHKQKIQEGILEENQEKKSNMIGKVVGAVQGVAMMATLAASVALVMNDESEAQARIDDEENYNYNYFNDDIDNDWVEAVKEYEEDEESKLADSMEEARNIANELKQDLEEE